MKPIRNRKYVANLPYRAAIRVIRKDHSLYGEEGTIIRVLENPSERPEHQWYDVILEKGVYARFRESDLEQLEIPS